MANVERTVKIIFGAVDETSQAFESVGKGLQKVEDRLGSITDPLAKTADALIKFEATVAAVGVAFLGFSLNESIKFGSALTDLGKQLDGGVAEANEYKDAIFDLSETFGVSSVAITESFANFKQAGFETSEAFDLVTASLQQVQVSELETAESSEFLVRILKGFGLAVQDVPKALDLINEATNNYALNTGQLSEALARTSSVASGANLSLEETIGILTPMIEKTQSAEISSTAFNTALQRMTSLNTEVAKGFAILGISQRDATGEIKTGNVILREAQDAFTGLSDSNKNLVSQYLAGQDQATKFRTVLEQGNRTLEITETALKGVGSSLENELTIRLSSAQTQLDQTSQAFINLAVAIGGQFKVETTGAVDAVGELITTFRKIVDEGGLKPLFDQLGPLLVNFEQSIRDISAVLPDAFAGLNFNALTDGFTALGDAVQSLFGDLDLTNAEDLEKALQNIINVGGQLLQATAGIVEGLKPFLQTAAQLVEEFGKLNPEIVKGGGLIAGYGKAINTLLGPIGALGEGLTALGAGLGAIGVSGIAKTLAGFANSAKVAGAATTALSTQTVATGAAIGTAAAASTALGAVYSYLGGEVVKEFASSLVDFLVPGLEDSADAVVDGINPFELLEKALFGVSDNAPKAAEALKTVVTPVKELSPELEKSSESILKLDNAFGLTGKQVAAFAQSQEKATDFIVKGNDESISYFNTIDLGKGVVELVPKSMADMTGSIDDSAKSMDEASKESDKFRIAMEKIASDERIANIEAKVSLDIASLQAETKQVVAAFESIDNTISSTGNLLEGLFGALSGANLRTKFLIEEQIEKENERRDKALKKQNELLDEKIANLREQTRRLARGDAIIKISGDGLKPHLEAFMWEIVQEVRVLATAEGQEFLKGL